MGRSSRSQMFFKISILKNFAIFASYGGVMFLASIIYLFRVSNVNTSIDVVLLSLMLTLNRYLALHWSFHCWLCTSKCLLVCSNLFYYETTYSCLLFSWMVSNIQLILFKLAIETPEKGVKYVRLLPTNCLSVFDHFVTSFWCF